MTIKICDVCKQSPNDQRHLELIHLSHEGFEPTALSWWFGKVTEMDICDLCLAKIFNSKVDNPTQSTNAQNT